MQENRPVWVHVQNYSRPDSGEISRLRHDCDNFGQSTNTMNVATPKNQEICSRLSGKLFHYNKAVRFLSMPLFKETVTNMLNTIYFCVREL